MREKKCQYIAYLRSQWFSYWVTSHIQRLWSSPLALLIIRINFGFKTFKHNRNASPFAYPPAYLCTLSPFPIWFCVVSSSSVNKLYFCTFAYRLFGVIFVVYFASSECTQKMKKMKEEHEKKAYRSFEHISPFVGDVTVNMEAHKLLNKSR